MADDPCERNTTWPTRWTPSTWDACGERPEASGRLRRWAGREPLPTGLVPAWNPEAAKAAAKAGALCPAVSCADARFAEVQQLFFTDSFRAAREAAARTNIACELEHLRVVRGAESRSQL